MASPTGTSATAYAVYDRTTSRWGRITMSVGLLFSLAGPVYLLFFSGLGRGSPLHKGQGVQAGSRLIEQQKLGTCRERALSDKERDKREEALKQQLDALRAIERGILEREETLRRRK